MIQPERVQELSRQPVQPGRYVLYWMQASQRAKYNHALVYAVRRANELGQPVLAVFGLTPHFPEATERHYRFLLEGLRETQRVLRANGIQLVVRLQDPPEAALALAREASLLVTDRGYLRVQRQWRERVAREAPCLVVQVESDVVVPVETASAKQEVAARTLRPKLHRQLDRYLVPLARTRLHVRALDPQPESLALDDLSAVLRRLHAPEGAAWHSPGGAAEARLRLHVFLQTGLLWYGESAPRALPLTSRLSPYLHFGQISPLEVALAVEETGIPGVEAFLEQLIVRRELAMNFVFYNPGYDEYSQAVPEWARRTLAERADDPRTLYTLRQLENAETLDPYWNAAMRQAAQSGYLDNHLRMYWGKQLVRWSPHPQEAFARLAYLNNKYFLDGRDPVSWASVAWCFGRHDRPWPPRPVFGTVRSMNAAGLRRKFDADGYARRVLGRDYPGEA